MTWQTVGVNQRSSSGTNFPFVAAPESVRYLLSDFFLAYEDDIGERQLPLRIANLLNFNDAGDIRRDVVVYDNFDFVVFDSTSIPAENYTDRAWGNSLRTMSWRSETGTCRCTMHTAPPPWDPDRTYNDDIWLNGILDPRTYYRMPRRVKSLRVGLVKVAGDVIFSEGFNMRLRRDDKPPVDGGRFKRRVAFRARPGDGLGRLPGCEDIDPVIRRINTVAPTSGGDFILDPVGCYRAQRPAIIVNQNPRQASLTPPNLSSDNQANLGVNLAQLLPFTPFPSREALQAVLESTSALQFFNDCGPCCECDDYVRTYEGLRGVDTRYRAIGARAGTVRDELQEAVDRWKKQRECRLFQSLRLTLSPEPNCTLYIGGVHCNMTQGCVSPLALRLTFEAFRDGAPLDLTGMVSLKTSQLRRSAADTKYEEVPFVPTGSWPVWDIINDNADPQGSSRFRMRLRLSGCEDTDTLRVTLSAHATASIDPTTGLPYELPNPDDVPVPSEVQAIWDDGNAPLYPVRAVLTKATPIGPLAGCGGG